MTQHNDRARESMAHWADLRSGDMYQGDEPTKRHFNVVFWLTICAGVTLAAAMLIGISALAADIPQYVPTPGYEMCKGSC